MDSRPFWQETPSHRAQGRTSRINREIRPLPMLKSLVNLQNAERTCNRLQFRWKTAPILVICAGSAKSLVGRAPSRRGSQVARRRSAKPLYIGSNPIRASNPRSKTREGESRHAGVAQSGTKADDPVAVLQDYGLAGHPSPRGAFFPKLHACYPPHPVVKAPSLLETLIAEEGLKT